MSTAMPPRNAPAEVARLVRENLGWLHSQALRLRRDPRYRAALGRDLDDYVNSGYLGLHRAAEMYDPAKGAFTTFATYWIKQAIQREAARFQPIHMPLRVRLQAGRVLRSLPPNGAVRQDQCDQAVRTLRAEVRRIHDLPELPVDGRELSPADGAMAHEMVDQVRHLPEMEQLVLLLRFGLDGDRPHTLQEIAELIGKTKERVRQIEARGLARLREGLQVPAAA